MLEKVSYEVMCKPRGFLFFKGERAYCWLESYFSVGVVPCFCVTNVCYACRDYNFNKKDPVLGPLIFFKIHIRSLVSGILNEECLGKRLQ